MKALLWILFSFFLFTFVMELAFIAKVTAVVLIFLIFFMLLMPNNKFSDLVSIIATVIIGFFAFLSPEHRFITLGAAISFIIFIFLYINDYSIELNLEVTTEKRKRRSYFKN